MVLDQELAQHGYAAALGLVHSGDRSDDRIFQEPPAQEDLIPRFLQLVKPTEQGFFFRIFKNALEIIPWDCSNAAFSLEKLSMLAEAFEPGRSLKHLSR